MARTAAVIVEAVGANMGVVPPKKGFLEGLRKLCDEYGALLIFDEVITGFRLAFGGAAEYFGVTPDLVTYGKIIGAGMPVGAYGGRREIMELVSPVGKVYQAGTLSGNPIAMAAGFTQLKYLYEHQEIYKDLEKKGERLYGGMEKIMVEKGLPYQVNHAASLGSLFFTDRRLWIILLRRVRILRRFLSTLRGCWHRGSIWRRLSLRRCSFLLHIRMR